MLGEKSFFEIDARGRVVAAVKEIESQTSAEIVVAVRGTSGSYRDVDYLFGFAVSLVTLGILLFHPHPFALEGMPLDVGVAFALGAVFCAKVHPLRRALVSAKRREKSSRAAARASFVEQGVSRTSGRNGILVFVSFFERRVAVVPDIGIDPEKLGPPWTNAVEALESSLAGTPSMDRFLERLRALGPVLGAAMPHRDDDVNELPDEVAE